MTTSVLTKVVLYLAKHKNKLFKAVLGLSTALAVSYGIIVHNENEKLSESLEMAKNNVSAYQNMISGVEQHNNVLQLTIDELQQNNDSIMNELAVVAKENKLIKQKLQLAASQKQTLFVNGGKGVKGDLVTILKDTTYTDSIWYNDQTKVNYTIGRDTVNVNIQLDNTQYLYTYKHKKYKNDKKFFKRLFTFDFKKTTEYKYDIINSNDLLKESDVRIIEIIND